MIAVGAAAEAVVSYVAAGEDDASDRHDEGFDGDWALRRVLVVECCSECWVQVFRERGVRVAPVPVAAGQRQEQQQDAEETEAGDPPIFVSATSHQDRDSGGGEDKSRHPKVEVLIDEEGGAQDGQRHEE